MNVCMYVYSVSAWYVSAYMLANDGVSLLQKKECPNVLISLSLSLFRLICHDEYC